MPNRLDLSRSAILAHGFQDPSVKAVLSIDSDVTIATSYTTLEGYLKQDFHDGFDMVLGMTLSANNVPMIDAVVPGTKFQEGCQEVNGGAFGFVAISRSGFEKLPILGYHDDLGGGRTPVYMAYEPFTTEDLTLCRILRENGGKVGLDTRIDCIHWKRLGRRAEFSYT
jgi:hypothetical protein